MCLFLLSCFSTTYPSSWTGAQEYFLLGAGLCISLWPLWVPVCPFLQIVEVPLNGSITMWCINHFSQFCFIYKLQRCTPPHCVGHYWRLLHSTGCSTNPWCTPLVTGLHATGCSCLRSASQPFFGPPYSYLNHKYQCPWSCDNGFYVISNP